MDGTSMDYLNEKPSFDGSLIVLDESRQDTPTQGVEFDPKRRLFSPMESSTPNNSGVSGNHSYVEMSTIQWHGDAIQKVVSDLEATIQNLQDSLEKLRAQKAELMKLL